MSEKKSVGEGNKHEPKISAIHYQIAVEVACARLRQIQGVCGVNGNLFCIGIMGEYVGRIYEQVKGRPLYVERARTPEP